MKPTDRKKRKIEFMGDKRFYGASAVGERGQFVIPKDARAEMKISPGDKLVVFGHAGHGLFIVKAERFRKLAEAVLGEI